MHIGYLPEVMATFPDATIVQCHRDAATAFASLCRLRGMWEEMTTGRLDPRQTARDQLRVWGMEWDRNQADRAALPPHSRFIDIDYVEIKDDAISVAERIYALARISHQAACLNAESCLILRIFLRFSDAFTITDCAGRALACLLPICAHMLAPP